MYLENNNNLGSGWQPLARMGATVTAIDAVDKNIKIASIHAVCTNF
jgi:2-polyprenyl-3-methyl-5-hydroxy-6-metoxy-1,4-benzoquinol methylase